MTLRKRGSRTYPFVGKGEEGYSFPKPPPGSLKRKEERGVPGRSVTGGAFPIRGSVYS